MTNKSWIEGMAALNAVFPMLNPSANAVAIWRALLDDLQDGTFLAAVHRICREVRDLYPGTNVVALIREHATGTTADLSARALASWDQALDAVRTIGTYESVTFDDRAIHSCIRSLVGGWIEFGQVPADKLVWLKKDWLALYPVMVQKSGHADYLRGINERANEAAGYLDDIRPPRRIGSGAEPMRVFGGNGRAAVTAGDKRETEEE